MAISYSNPVHSLPVDTLSQGQCFCAEDTDNQLHILGFAQIAKKKKKRCALHLSPVQFALDFSFSASFYPKEAGNTKWNYHLGRKSIYLICSLTNGILIVCGTCAIHVYKFCPYKFFFKKNLNKNSLQEFPNDHFNTKLLQLIWKITENYSNILRLLTIFHISQET